MLYNNQSKVFLDILETFNKVGTFDNFFMSTLKSGGTLENRDPKRIKSYKLWDLIFKHKHVPNHSAYFFLI